MFKKIGLTAFIYFMLGSPASWAVYPLDEEPSPIEDNNIIMVLNLTQDHSQGPEIHETLKDVRRLFPRRRVRVVYPMSVDNLRDQLEIHVEGDDKISHLLIHSHGTGTDREITVDIQKDRLRISVPEKELTPQNIEKEVFSSPSNRRARTIFGPIRGRFTEDSQIILHGGDQMQGHRELAKNKIATLQAILGQTSGTFYVNQTREYYRPKLSMPFWLQDTPLNGAVTLTFHVLAFLSAKNAYDFASGDAELSYLTYLATATVGVVPMLVEKHILNRGIKAQTKDAKLEGVRNESYAECFQEFRESPHSHPPQTPLETPAQAAQVTQKRRFWQQ